MSGEPEQGNAEVIVGVFGRRGAVEDSGPPRPSEAGAEVIRFAPYLLARRGRAVAPPAHGA